jgi:hypothetical protein
VHNRVKETAQEWFDLRSRLLDGLGKTEDTLQIHADDDTSAAFLTGHGLVTDGTIYRVPRVAENVAETIAHPVMDIDALANPTADTRISLIDIEEVEKACKDYKTEDDKIACKLRNAIIQAEGAMTLTYQRECVALLLYKKSRGSASILFRHTQLRYRRHGFTRQLDDAMFEKFGKLLVESLSYAPILPLS